MRRSGSIALVLIGTSLAAMGFSAHRPRPVSDDDDASFDDFQQFVYHSTGNPHVNDLTWVDDYRHRSSSDSASRSFSSSSSHTTRGGFGSTGHSVAS